MNGDTTTIAVMITMEQVIRKSNIKIGNVSRQLGFHDTSKIEQSRKSSSSLRRMLQGLKQTIFIEFDDVSHEEDNKGVGQEKLTEGLEEQEKRV